MQQYKITFEDFVTDNSVFYCGSVVDLFVKFDSKVQGVYTHNTLRLRRCLCYSEDSQIDFETFNNFIESGKSILMLDSKQNPSYIIRVEEV